MKLIKSSVEIVKDSLKDHYYICDIDKQILVNEDYTYEGHPVTAYTGEDAEELLKKYLNAKDNTIDGKVMWKAHHTPSKEDLLTNIYKQIELAGRTCYKSEPKYNYFRKVKTADGSIHTEQVSNTLDFEDSIAIAEREYAKGNTEFTRSSSTAKDFVDRMIKSGHTAMLEHGTVYLKFKNNALDFESVWYDESSGYPLNKFYENNKYSKVYFKPLGVNDKQIEKNYTGDYYITTNYRVIIENDRLDDLQYLCEPTKYHEKRITARFICDRGVSHEFVRHRVFSFAQESTRFCNYSKDKFGNELTFIEPAWNMSTTMKQDFEDDLEKIEDTYLLYIEQEGLKPQEARAILPNALKTELVITGFESDWKHFFKLRCAENAHPDARKLALELQEKMNKL